MAILDLEEYKLAIGETSSANDDRHQAAIDAAEQAILNFTDRDFGTASVVEDRTFWLEAGSVFLEIDDCTEVNDVSGIGVGTWSERSEGPAASFGVYTYIQLGGTYSTSPEMGFARNEDIFGVQSYRSLGVEVTVNADWGWTVVPEDVKRAAIWAAASFEKDTQNPYGALSSKSVAEVSESYYMVAANPNFLDEGLPAKVQSLLFPYRRVLI